MIALGLPPVLPPSASASRIEALRGLWTDAGLAGVETHEITVQRTFAGFDDFWSTTTGSTLKSTLAGMEADTVERLKERVRRRLPFDGQGRITYGARANAVKGRVPKSA